MAACGSRGPLDDFPTTTSLDAGTDALVSVDSGSGEDSAPPSVDAAVDAGSGLVQCGTCVAQQCGTDVAACLGDSACRDVIQCVTTTCLGLGGTGGGGGGGGGIDPTCLLGCSSGGGAGVGEALGVFQCLTSDCGTACGGLLGGLGGLGGFPMPAPPSLPSGGKHDVSAERAMYQSAFSAWPELLSTETTANGR